MNIASILGGPVRTAGLLLIASAVAAHATPTDTNTITSMSSGWAANTTLQNISNSDLLEQGSTSFSTLTANNPANTSIPGINTENAGLNDGADIGDTPNFGASAYYAYNYTHGAVTAKSSLIVGSELAGGEVLTFNLNLVTSPLGYDVNTVNSFAAWTDHASVSNQNFTLEYSLAGAPGTFLPVTSVAYNPNDPTSDDPGGGGVATEVSLTGLNLTDVAALRFTYTADPTSLGGGPSGTGIWLQEIDALGSPSIAETPEPGTWAMLLFALSGLALFSLRRRANS